MTTRGQLIALGIRSRSPVLNALTIDVATFLTTAAGGAAIGTLSGKTAGSTIAITPADNVLALDGAQTGILRGVGAVTAGTYAYTFTETLAGAVNSPRVTVINFTVSAPVVTLNTLTVDVTAFLSNVSAASVIGNIGGKTAGSTIAITPADNVLALNGGQNQVIRGVGAVTAGTPSYTFTETLAGAVGSPKATAIGFTITDPVVVTSLIPAGDWDGTGWGSATTKPNGGVNYTRVHAQAAAQIHCVDRVPYTADKKIIIMGDAYTGIANVKGYCSGGSPITVTTRSWVTENDINGVAKTYYGYVFTLDWSATRTRFPTGAVECWFEVTANDGAMEKQLLGPYTFYPRLASTDWDQTTPALIGSTYEYDALIKIDKSLGGDTLGVAYRKISTACNYLIGNTTGKTFKFPLLRIDAAGDQVFNDGVSTFSHARATWTTIRAKTGLNATIGDGSADPQGAYGMDTLCFRGANLTVDLIKIGPAGHNQFRLEGNSPGCNKLLWFDGIELTQSSSALPLAYGSGSGYLYDGTIWSSNWISVQDGTPSHVSMTDCHVHDLGKFSIGNCQLTRGNNVQMVAGSVVHNNMGLVYGNTVDQADPNLTGLRNFLDAFSIYYSGAGTPTILMTSNSGNDRVLTLRVNGSVVGTMPTIISGPAGGSAYPYQTATLTKVAAVVAWINTQTNWHATEISQPRGATHLVYNDGSNSADGFGGGVTPRAVSTNSGAPTVMQTMIDVHIDVIATTSATYQNYVVMMNRFLRCNGLHISVASDASLIDVVFQWNEIADTSTVSGVGGYLEPGGNDSNPYNTVCKHFVVRYNSEYGGGEIFESTFGGDAYTLFDHNSFEFLALSNNVGHIGTTASAVISNNAHRQGTAMAGEVGAKLLSNGYTKDQIYRAPADSTAFDFTPNSMLQLADFSYPGSRDSLGHWNGAGAP